MSDRVLLVEDNRVVTKVIRHLLQHQFEGEERDCVSVASYAETQTVLDSGENFLVAIADLNLPDAPNGEVVDLLLNSGVPVIVLTGSFDDRQREIFLAKPIVDYVVKESRYSYEYAIRLVRRIDRNRRVRIMVVDDSLTSRRLIANLLRNHLYQVIEAGDGEEAIKIVGQHPDIRMIITDYQMPKMDGCQLVRQIRQQVTGRLPIALIGISSTDSPNLSARFIKNGANDYLSKPFSTEEFYCRVMQNIETLEYLEQIRDAADRDYLTRLFNRRYFFENVPDMFNMTSNGDWTVAMIDIDHFKSINDRLGHDAGDQVLIEVARRLQDHFKEGVVARFGGEEFALVVAGGEEAVESLERFRESIAAKAVELGGGVGSVSVTLSIGYNRITNGDEASLETRINQADAALYRAKRGGRNRVEG
jgi:diguanylate cyclase (GGDEF)-like protein